MSSPAWIRFCRPIPHLEVPHHRNGFYACGPVVLDDAALFTPPVASLRPQAHRNFIAVVTEREVARRARAYVLTADDLSVCRMIASIDRAIREVLPFDLIGQDAARRSLIVEFGSRPGADDASSMTPPLRSLGATPCVQTLIEELLGVFLARCPKGYPNA